MITTTTITTVSFHGATLIVHPGDSPATTLVAMKPVVQGIGLSWQPQHRKILEHPVLGLCVTNLMMQMPDDDQHREHLFLPLNRLNFWLATIQPNKVPDPETRTRIVRYQIECADVLFAHFFGQAAASVLVQSIAASIRELGRCLEGLKSEVAELRVVRDPRAATTDYRAAIDVVAALQACPKGRRPLAQRAGNAMARLSAAWQVPIKLCPVTGRRMFSAEVAGYWIEKEGRQTVRDHNAAVVGQGVLDLEAERRKRSKGGGAAPPPAPSPAPPPAS